MQHADPDLTWSEWDDAHPAADEADRLGALREYIAATARRWVHSCTYDAAWANKKLAKLGIVDRIEAESTYVLAAPVMGTQTKTVYARNRAEAEEKFRLLVIGRVYVADPVITGAVAFASGPEDSQALPDDDAPQTVDATLVTLREIILLGHIAGPHICEEEANKVLASYGLPPIPPRKQFKVTRPIEGEMVTTVEAYDESSAERVARWRWENNRTGYEVTNVDPTDEAAVTATL